MNYGEAESLLKEKGQEQLLKFYDELSEAERANLLARIEKIDWSFEKALKAPEDLSGRNCRIEPIAGMRLPEIARRREEFRKVGAEAISGKARWLRFCLRAAKVRGWA